MPSLAAGQSGLEKPGEALVATGPAFAARDRVPALPAPAPLKRRRTLLDHALQEGGQFQEATLQGSQDDLFRLQLQTSSKPIPSFAEY